VLTEIGIDCSHHYSKTIDALAGQTFDHVITLCGDANDKCPLFFGGVKRVHIGFDDPSRCTGSPRDILAEFRRVRDEIRQRISDYLTGADT
jgi:arsenate reductase